MYLTIAFIVAVICVVGGYLLAMYEVKLRMRIFIGHRKVQLENAMNDQDEDVGMAIRYKAAYDCAKGMYWYVMRGERYA